MKRHTFALLCFFTFGLLSCPAFAARFVPIKVYLDGELILEGNASDNGHRDADAVWDALRQADLGETDAFIKLFGKDLGDEIKIWKKSDSELPLKITIDVAYGGVAVVTALRVKRQRPDAAGRVWRLHPDDVANSFSKRLIKRSYAARLSNPRREK